MYIQTCRANWSSPATFLTPEEHYDYAISLLNTGYYEEAHEQFGNILADHPEADYALYGLALLDSITGALKIASGIWPEPLNSIPGTGSRPAPTRLPKHGGRSPLYRASVSRDPVRASASATRPKADDKKVQVMILSGIR